MPDEDCRRMRAHRAARRLAPSRPRARLLDLPAQTLVQDCERSWSGRNGDSMRYTGDKDMRCGKCGKTTRHKRCPRCDGKVGPNTTCGHCGSTGYKCQNGMSDA